MAIPTVDEVWADFNADGSVKEPSKQDIRRLLRFIQAIAAANGMKTYPNKMAMDADLTQADGTPALLWADPVEANNYPTVWTWNDPTNQWIAGVDRISPLQLVLDALAAVIVPNSKLTVGGVNLIQRFTTPTPSGNRVSGGITDDFFHALFKGLKLVGSGGATLANSADPNVLLRVKGSNGRVLMQLHADPTKTFGPWAKSSGSATTNSLGADIIHVVVYGQSLGEGAESLPVMSTAQTGHGAFKFVRGVRTWKVDAYKLNPAGRPDGDFVLTPLLEVQDGAVGETIATAMAATLKEFICGPNSPVRRDSAPQILVTFAGRGGRFLDELSKVPVQPDGDGGYYDTTIDDVRRAKQYAVRQGKSYSVAGIVWMQGEANNALQMVRAGPVLSYADFLAQYQASLLALADNLDADIRAITLQPGRIPFFIYQTGALSLGPASGQAQMNAAAAQPNKIVAVGPTYFVPSARNSYYNSSPQVRGQEVHLSADGERWFGSNVGKALYRYLVLRQTGLALKPILARKIDSTTIELVLAVPRAPVRIDTSLLPAQGGAAMGFAVYYGTGDAATAGPAISAVTVVDVDRLQIKLASPLSAGTISLAYGQSRFVANLSATVADWRDGSPMPNGNASKELVFNGSLASEVSKLLEEGCFFINNVTLGTQKTWIARFVSEAGGQTTFKGDAAEVLAGGGFAVGNTVSVSRPLAYGYGNVCDSDTAESPLSFADHTYGNRTGRYPLANWLVAFKDLVTV